jgi:glycosyltransferase involved in cell wall biosynthesis
MGRLSKEKNPLFLISAAKYLLSKHITNFIIHIAGHGHQENELIEQIEFNNLNTYFNLVGFQKNIVPFLQESHCLVLPSLWEGMPVVIIEAAASKLPIVSTPVGSIPDFLSSKNAYLSELDDFPEAMVEVMKNYELALEKSNKLYEEMKSSFDINNVYEKHLRLYKSIV